MRWYNNCKLIIFVVYAIKWLGDAAKQNITSSKKKSIIFALN